jgi:GxxExxY protein
MTDNQIAHEIVDSAFRVHVALGPGLLESVYEAALAHEVTKRGLALVRQQPIPVFYDSVRLAVGFRADLIVEGRVIVEVKAVESLAPIHRMQVLSYLRAADLKIGLLINFNSVLLKHGRRRVVNGLEE